MRRVVEGKSIIAPLTLLGYSDDRMLQLQCARTNTAALTGELAAVAPQRIGDSGKIRVAYVSADFRQHAVGFLVAELIERHDRLRFETIGISLGPDDGGEMRRRFATSFDHFHDMSAKSDEEISNLLRKLQTNIAVDLMGLTRGARPGIFKRRAAPVQVNYLGYPGTAGATFIDYVIADPVVAPFADQPFFEEKIVHLPDCYQANDSVRTAGAAPTRREAGLPADCFVFCCFNNHWKITAPVFDIWMRLLLNVPGSVLWLIDDNGGATTRLRHEAAARGVEPDRIVFAPQMALDRHLDRHQLADLFLDTLPYNAHTTASDALRVGVPIVTRKGESFAGRVAASLLSAIGLPEMVTDSPEDYEALALSLARNPAALRKLREKLVRNRTTHPLFDGERFRRHMEAAYVTMHNIEQAQEPTLDFAVTNSTIGG